MTSRWAEEYFDEPALEAIELAVSAAAGGSVISLHLLHGIAQSFESRAARALWLLGVEGVELTTSDEPGSPGFSPSVAALFRKAYDEAALNPAPAVWGTDSRVGPQNLVRAMLNVDCQAGRELALRGVDNSSFGDKLAGLDGDLFTGDRFKLELAGDLEATDCGSTDLYCTSISLLAGRVRWQVSADLLLQLPPPFAGYATRALREFLSACGELAGPLSRPSPGNDFGDAKFCLSHILKNFRYLVLLSNSESLRRTARLGWREAVHLHDCLTLIG